jgi:hypothetical protein
MNKHVTFGIKASSQIDQNFSQDGQLKSHDFLQWDEGHKVNMFIQEEDHNANDLELQKQVVFLAILSYPPKSHKREQNTTIMTSKTKMHMDHKQQCKHSQHKVMKFTW